MDCVNKMFCFVDWNQILLRVSENTLRIYGFKITSKLSKFKCCVIKLVVFSIHQIPDETFEHLHSLEWLKLWNNELEGLSYSLMEPVLDTLKHLDIHSE